MRSPLLMVAALAAILLFGTPPALAQTGLGSLRGVVTDAQGGALPGVTVTATSPDMIGPQIDVTNERGEYRLINLSPGTFKVTAELPGFATFIREGILIRTGSTFQVNVQMQISALQETVTVSGESPMIEVDKPSNVLNIDGEFQRLMPIQARRNYSDFLELTPGVISRGFDDGSGRQVYFGHATEHFAHVFQLENTLATTITMRSSPTSSMGADMVRGHPGQDRRRRRIVADGRRHRHERDHQERRQLVPRDRRLRLPAVEWNGNNVDNCSDAPGCKPGSGGTPTTASSISSTRRWAARSSVTGSGSSARCGARCRGRASAGPPAEVERIQAFSPGAALFDNTSESWQPFFKVTSKIAGHDVTGFYQRDWLLLTGEPRIPLRVDPGAVHRRLALRRKDHLGLGHGDDDDVHASIQQQERSDADTFVTLGNSGPQIIIHNGHRVGRRRWSAPAGSSRAATSSRYNYQPASQVVLRGDLTHYKDDWMGAHQFQTGFLAAPRNSYDAFTTYRTSTTAAYFEEHRLINPDNPALGTVPFHRRARRRVSLHDARRARQRHRGLHPGLLEVNGRLTLNLGVRVDFVKRDDDLQLRPAEGDRVRAAVRLLVPGDARTRATSCGASPAGSRAVMGRDNVTTFGAGGRPAALRSTSSIATATASARSMVTPRRAAASIADVEFADDLHQPYIDEFIIGFRKQFAGQLSSTSPASAAATTTTRRGSTSTASIPSGANQPFGGFGLIDPNRGIIFQQHEQHLEHAGLHRDRGDGRQAHLSNNFQMMVGLNHQWQHMAGTWNPTDPARFIQPDHLRQQQRAVHAARQQRAQQPAARHRHHRPHLRADVAAVFDALRRLVRRAVGYQPRGQLHDDRGSVVGSDRRSAASRAIRSSQSSARRASRWPTARRRATRWRPSSASREATAATGRCRRRR